MELNNIEARKEMESDIEERLKSFTGQLQTECGILERLVYKHKNQHRRSCHFQHILKVRRDLKLLKSAKLEEVFDASFIVINGNRPKQKLQLLESLKRCDGNKYNFLERLLGVARLLSQMIEPMLKAAIEISTLLAQSFFMKFSLTMLAVLARIRVLVQQMLLDSVHVYNVVSTLSQKEQTVKLNQDGFEVFREYYPKRVEAIVILECIWQTDKFVLVERINEPETKNVENDKEDILLKTSNIQYQNIGIVLGVHEPGSTDVENVTMDPVQNNAEQHGSNSKHVENASDTSEVIATETNRKRSIADCSSTAEPPKSLSPEAGLPSSFSASPTIEDEVKKKKKVAFVSVKPPAPANANQMSLQVKGLETKSDRVSARLGHARMQKGDISFILRADGMKITDPQPRLTLRSGSLYEKDTSQKAG